MREDIFVQLIEMPTDKVKEAVCTCYDGYMIYIDQNLTMEEQREAYEHAMIHINRNDCYDDMRSVCEKENI